MRKHYQKVPVFCWPKRALLRGALALAIVLAWLGTWQPAAAQELDVPSRPQCYAPASLSRVVVAGNSCTQYPEYGPVAYAEQGLPKIPIKTVRIMFHVIQKDDGTGNWQSPSQDGGADETILRGLVYGLPYYPLGTNRGGRNIRGVNNIYGQLDERLTYSSPNPWANREGTPVQGDAADSRIRFQLEDIRYYRNTESWDMTDGRPGCAATSSYDCVYTLHEKFVNANAALTPEQKTHIIHIFFTENPGLPSTRVDQFGNMVSHYGFGGGAGGAPGTYAYIRGSYWTLKNHPFWSENGVRNVNPYDPQQAFRQIEYVMAHELGHCLGLWHTFDGTEVCTTSDYNNDPPPTSEQGQTNNIMDAANLPGNSLSQCQVGKMHYFLGHAGLAFLDRTLVEDYCGSNSAEDVTIAAGKTVVWSSAHNLHGNLYIEPGASLTVRCRVGFVGPQAKIVVRGGGELILDNGTIGNYATSDTQECGNSLVLWLGGDGTGLDGDNSGLISIRNGGGFTSELVDARLTAGATLHIGPVPVLIDGTQLATQAGSFLCVEQGATFTYGGKARFSIEPGTNMGLNPAINLRATCQSNLCDITAQTVAFTASTLLGGSISSGGGNGGTAAPICPGSPVTMHAYFADAGGSTVTWYKGNTLVSNGADFTDAPTGTSSVVYSVVVNNGCQSFSWSFTQPVAPASSLSLQANAAAVCVESSGTNYDANGWFILNSLNASLRDPNASANQNMTPFWQDPAAPAVAVLRKRGLSTTGYTYLLDVKTLRARGVTSYPLQLCNQVTGEATICPTCAPVTINLQIPTYTVLPSIAKCPGQAVQLQANVPAGASCVWQPGGLQGSSVAVSPTTTTTYTATIGGCQAVQQVTVTVLPATCTSCLSGPTVKVNANGTTVFSAYTFVAGTSYLFSQSTEFTTGTFAVPEGATLLFEANVKLTLRDGASLYLTGGRLTGTCDEMWTGIVADASSGGVVAKQPPTVPFSEISHSRYGLRLFSNADTGPAPTLQLDYVAFLHNGLSLTVENKAVSSAPFAGVIDHCQFDSDSRQMRKPWQYQSAQKLYVTQRHVSLAGNCANLFMTNSTLDHALLGVWAPISAPFTAKGNIFRNFYVAGVYAHDLLPANTYLSYNQFIYPPANNEIVGSHSTQLSDLFTTDVNEGPNSVLREGVCVGIFGPTVTKRGQPVFVLENNSFTQPVGLTSYNSRVMYPQHGVIIGGGIVRHNTFRDLYIAYMSGSTQEGGQVRDNYFYSCLYGVYFANDQNHSLGTQGEAVVSCNTFERRNGLQGSTTGIMRDYCQAYYATDPCTQINISTEVDPAMPGQRRPILQKNLFLGNAYGNDHFYHIYNHGSNSQITYTTFANPVAANVIVNDASLVQVIAATDVLTSSTTATQSNPANDCASDGYQNGLQGRLTATTPDKANVPAARAAYLAQNVPNPCTGSTLVSYRTPVGSEEALLVVRDFYSGAVVLRQAVPAGEHTVELNVAKLLPGGYHYALEVNGRPVAHHNLLVQ